MKNRKFLGHLPEQSVRQKSKPFIIEMDDKYVKCGHHSISSLVELLMPLSFCSYRKNKSGKPCALMEER